MSRRARESGSKNIPDLAAMYAKQLPSPVDIRRKNGGKEGIDFESYTQERPVPTPNTVGKIIADEPNLFHLLNGYGKKVIGDGLEIAKDYQAVRNGYLDTKYLFEVVALLDKEDALDLIVLTGIKPETLLTEFDIHKIRPRLVLTPTKLKISLEGIASDSVSKILRTKGLQLSYAGNKTLIYEPLKG